MLSVKQAVVWMIQLTGKRKLTNGLILRLVKNTPISVQMHYISLTSRITMLGKRVRVLLIMVKHTVVWTIPYS